jgi:hypothetical protein
VKLVLTRLPERAGPEVDRACRSIGLAGSPVFVPVVPAPDALANRCIHNVRRAAERGEGDVVVGWKILAWPRILVQFIGHAVLKSGERLVCITPDSHGDEQILFVADPSLTFDASDPMARMPSQQAAVDPHPDVAAFISVHDQIRALKERFPPSSGSLLLTGADAVAFARLERSQVRLIREISLRTLRPNEPCVCDSGRRFRKCCQRDMLRARQME